MRCADGAGQSARIRDWRPNVRLQPDAFDFGIVCPEVLEAMLARRPIDRPPNDRPSACGTNVTSLKAKGAMRGHDALPGKSSRYPHCG